MRSNVTLQSGHVRMGVYGHLCKPADFLESLRQEQKVDRMV